MELYTLDDNLRRMEVVDNFESLIWTDRFAGVGDFQLDIHSTPDLSSILIADTRLACNVSNRLMKVDTVVRKTTEDGKRMLTVTGRSTEQIFEDRIVSYNFQPTWKQVDKPHELMRTIFVYIFSGGLIPQDAVSEITHRRITNSIPFSDIPITIEQEPVPMAEFFKDLCEAYGMGYRIVRDPADKKLYFEVYAGNNRTTDQSAVPAVIFSPDLDSLSDITEMNSSSQYKNVAYVLAKNGLEIVYASGVSPSVAGMDRRVIYVSAYDIDLPAGAELTDILRQKGYEALSQAQNIQMFDGEVPQFGTYQPGRDYDLGDLVEMRTDEGVTNLMRVSEQIYISDAEGDRTYPTLTLDTFITPGSWKAWDYNMTWAEATGTWQDAAP